MEIRDNAIMAIHPFKKHGMWVFNDDTTGLVEEPFVQGIPEIIEILVKDIPNAEQGFTMLFSSDIFPESTGMTKVERPDAGNGTWYYCPSLDKTGWLCPALFKYFDRAPEQLYAKAEPLKG